MSRSDTKALHVRFSGFSASFRHPLTLTGMQLTTPVPAYSTILGLISACAGKIIGPSDTQLGFEFRAISSDNIEIERTNRLQFKAGVLAPHRSGQSIMSRQVHFEPSLELFVTNLELRSAFESPVSTPCLGRSQDVAWIDFVREVNLFPIEEGDVGATLLPRPYPVRGLILRLPEWMDNHRIGYVRKTGPFGFYMASSPTDTSRIHVKGPRLYHPSDGLASGDAIYIHEWTKLGSAWLKN